MIASSLRGRFPSEGLQRVELPAQLHEPIDGQTRARRESAGASGFLAHPRRQQSECAVALTDDQMLRPGESLPVQHRDRLTEARMEWVVDDHLTRQTPGIVTLPRPAPARVTWPPPSASPSSRTVGACCSRAPASSCSVCRWRGANLLSKARSPSSTSITC